MDRLAEKLAAKMQSSILDQIYRDAGSNLFGLIRKSFWAFVVAFAAWGAARYGGQG